MADATTAAVDYLVVGAGATGMAFADTLLTETNATIAIVDRLAQPGGHWNNAYPFVRLHQTSANYGANSAPLGSGAKDTTGFNAGFYELASGPEIVAYFDNLMRRRFLPSGRVRYFPLHDHTGGGALVSRLNGATTRVRARKTVDARYLETRIPSTHAPAYDVASGVPFAPVNDLPRLARAGIDIVIIGAGKTGIDACVWLMENGFDPARVQWIMPRDPWLANRANFQFSDETFEHSCAVIADQVEATAQATSIEVLLLRLEELGHLFRIDRAVTPTAYHCATISPAELDLVRRIRGVVRMGRVSRISADRIVLRDGEIATTPQTLHIDCSANALNYAPPVPVFAGDVITLQYVRQCQPAFSAALIAHIEASRADDDAKNDICRPIPPPDIPADWARMFATELRNRMRWQREADIGTFQAAARLDAFTALARRRAPHEPAARAHLERYSASIAAARTNLAKLLS